MENKQEQPAALLEDEATALSLAASTALDPNAALATNVTLHRITNPTSQKQLAQANYRFWYCGRESHPGKSLPLVSLEMLL